MDCGKLSTKRTGKLVSLSFKMVSRDNAENTLNKKQEFKLFKFTKTEKQKY